MNNSGNEFVNSILQCYAPPVATYTKIAFFGSFIIRSFFHSCEMVFLISAWQDGVFEIRVFAGFTMALLFKSNCWSNLTVGHFSPGFL